MRRSKVRIVLSWRVDEPRCMKATLIASHTSGNCALADLCGRESLQPYETVGVLAVAFTWSPELPRDPTPLLRSFLVAA